MYAGHWHRLPLSHCCNLGSFWLLEGAWGVGLLLQSHILSFDFVEMVRSLDIGVVWQSCFFGAAAVVPGYTSNPTIYCIKNAQIDGCDFQKYNMYSYQVIQAVTFSSPGWRSLNLWKGMKGHVFTIPQKVTSRIARYIFLACCPNLIMLAQQDSESRCYFRTPTWSLRSPHCTRTARLTWIMSQNDWTSKWH